MVTGLAVRVASLTAFSRRRRLIGLCSALSRYLLRILNFNVVVDDHLGDSFSGRDRALVLVNHLSYFDAMIVAAKIPGVFVTSRDIEETPFLGHMSRAGGCIHVERRNSGALLKDVSSLAATLEQGFNVVLFPEGSTSDGSCFLRFKSSLIESAMRSRSRIVPVCLRYTLVAGERFGPSNADLVAWYGDMKFLPHLLRLLTVDSVDVRLSILPAPRFRAHKSRKLLTRDVRNIIEEAYHEPL